MINTIFVILYAILSFFFWSKATMHFELEEKAAGYWNLFCSAACGAGIGMLLL